MRRGTAILAAAAGIFSAVAAIFAASLAEGTFLIGPWTDLEIAIASAGLAATALAGILEIRKRTRK